MTAPIPSSDAERALVGAVMVQPDAFDAIGLDSRYFQHPLCALAWEAFANLRADAIAIDEVTVTNALHEEHESARRDMPSFLSECSLRSPTADNADFYADIVRRNYVSRKTMHALSGVIEKGRTGNLDGDDLVGEALAVISRIDTGQPDGALPIGEIVQQRINRLEEIARARSLGETVYSGFPTGVSALDEFLGGLQPGLATLVSARPGMGKSSFGMGIADACSSRGIGVHIFSLEDVRDKYADRAMSRKSRVPAQDMQQCKLNRDQLVDIQQAVKTLRHRKHWIVDDRSGITVEELVRSVRRRRRENNTHVVIVDYLQLLARPRHAHSMHEWHSHNMNYLADAAKADGIAYVVMSQLNRNLEHRPNKRPILSDLRESGTMEERAKCVIALYRGSEYGPPVQGVDYEDRRPTDGEWRSMIELRVLKNQNGDTGTVEAEWNGPTTTISDKR